MFVLTLAEYTPPHPPHGTDPVQSGAGAILFFDLFVGADVNNKAAILPGACWVIDNGHHWTV